MQHLGSIRSHPSEDEPSPRFLAAPHPRPPPHPSAPPFLLQASVIKAAGTREQRVWRSRLGGIVEATAGCELSPCIIVVGAVAAGLQAAAAAAGADAAGYASVAED